LKRSQRRENPDHIAVVILRKEDAMEIKSLFKVKCPVCGAEVKIDSDSCESCRGNFSSRLERDREEFDWTQVIDWVQSLEISEGTVVVPSEIKKIIGAYHKVSPELIGTAKFLNDTVEVSFKKVDCFGGVLTTIPR